MLDDRDVATPSKAVTNRTKPSCEYDTGGTAGDGASPIYFGEGVTMIHARREIPEHPVIYAMELWGEYNPPVQNQRFWTAPFAQGGIRGAERADLWKEESNLPFTGRIMMR